MTTSTVVFVEATILAALEIPHRDQLLERLGVLLSLFFELGDQRLELGLVEELELVGGDTIGTGAEALALEQGDEVEQLLDDLSLSSLKYKVNNKTHIFGNALDHVFYRQLEPMSNQVIEVSSSDHNPISVSYRLRRS